MSIHNGTKPVRVLHICGDSRFGGGAWIIMGLGRVSQAQGWQVDVLTTDPRFQRAVKQAGLGLVDLDVIRRPIRPFWDFGGLVRLRDFLRRQPYGIVHTHTSKGGFVGRLAARMAGTPVIVHTVHGFAFHEASPAMSVHFYSILERVASKWCDRIVSVSEFHRSWALELGICGPRDILAIPNGVAPSRTDSSANRAVLRRALGVQDDEVMILNMARLASDKGINFLIEAAAMLPQLRCGLRFVIAGEGPVRAELEQLAVQRGVTDRLKFLGHREDGGNLLSASDLVIVPSLREGMSMSLLEAMSAAKPIIASSIGSHRELAAQSDMIRLVPPGNPKALSEAIQDLATNPAEMTRLGTNAYASYQRNYTEERMLQDYLRLYGDLLESKGRRQ